MQSLKLSVLLDFWHAIAVANPSEGSAQDLWLPNQYEFNRHLMMDTFYAKDIRGVAYGLLNIIDDATNFQVVACIGELQGF